MIPSAGLVPGTVLLQAPEEDAGTVSWRLYRNPLRVLEAWRQEEVLPLLQEVEAALAQGRHAAGFLAYEAAPAFDPALTVHPSKPGLPLAWFGLYAGWEPAEPPPAESEPAAALPLPDWRPSLPEADYRDAVTRIREKIAAGETYQVNFTLRLRADWPENCDPAAFFHAMCRAQRPLRCAALVHAGRHLLLSASPELFFDRAGDGHITGRPMKGTAPRRPDAAGDRAAAAVLAACPKNRAENVMITDMIRNDLGRIAVPGSVAAPRLFETETYSTLHQLTSTVTARTAAALPELLGALFPCASITGAPKVQAMRIIRELEADPRGIYTGAIGFAEPGGRARFNVAIRTVDLDLKTGCAEFGAGGGVVWDSTPEGEYAECLIKARVLTARRPRFHLFETLRWTPARGFTLLRRHLDRLAASAAYFSFPLDEAIARYALHQEVANSVTAAPAPPRPAPGPLAAGGRRRAHRDLDTAAAVDTAAPLPTPGVRRGTGGSRRPLPPSQDHPARDV